MTLIGRGVDGQLRHQQRDEDGGVPPEVPEPAVVLGERRLPEALPQPVDHVQGGPVIPAVRVAVTDDQLVRHRMHLSARLFLAIMKFEIQTILKIQFSVRNPISI